MDKKDAEIEKDRVDKKGYLTRSTKFFHECDFFTHNHDKDILWSFFEHKTLNDMQEEYRQYYADIHRGKCDETEKILIRQLKNTKNEANSLRDVVTVYICLELQFSICMKKNKLLFAQKILMSIRAFFLRHAETLASVYPYFIIVEQCDQIDQRFVSLMVINKSIASGEKVISLLTELRARLLGARATLIEFIRAFPDPEIQFSDQQRDNSRSISFEEAHNIWLIDDLLPDVNIFKSVVSDFHTIFIMIFKKIVQFAIDAYENLPCRYCICVCGSLANGLPCLYSDVEWLILIENESKENIEFFTKVANLVSELMIGMGETPHENGPNIFSFESRGFGEDPSGLSPLNQRNYQLISTPDKLAHCLSQFREYSVEFINSLLHTSCIMGDNELHEMYLQGVSQYCYSDSQYGLLESLAVDLISGYQQEFATRLDKIRAVEEQSFNVKRDVFRILTLFVDALSLLNKIPSTSLFNKIQLLSQQSILGIKARDNITSSICLAYLLRNKAQSHYKEECEAIFYQRPNCRNQEFSHQYTITEQDRHYLNHIYRCVIPVYNSLATMKNMIASSTKIQFHEQEFKGDDILKLSVRYSCNYMSVPMANESARSLLQLYRAINPLDLDGLMESCRKLIHNPAETEECMRCALEIYTRTSEEDSRHYMACLDLALLCLRIGIKEKNKSYLDLFQGYIMHFLECNLDRAKHTKLYVLAYLYCGEFCSYVNKPNKAIQYLAEVKSILKKYPLKNLAFLSIGAQDDLPIDPADARLAREDPIAITNDGMSTEHWHYMVEVSKRLARAYLQAQSVDLALKQINKSFKFLDHLWESGRSANHHIHLDCMILKAEIYQEQKNFHAMWVTLETAFKNQRSIYTQIANHNVFMPVMCLIAMCFQNRTHIQRMLSYLHDYIGCYDPECPHYYYHENVEGYALYEGNNIRFSQHRNSHLFMITAALTHHLSATFIEVAPPTISTSALKKVLVEENSPEVILGCIKEALYAVKTLVLEPISTVELAGLLQLDVFDVCKSALMKIKSFISFREGRLVKADLKLLESKILEMTSAQHIASHDNIVSSIRHSNV